MKKIFSANQFTNEEDLPFSAADYSNFKYGCKDVARKYGKELAHKFFKSEIFQSIISNNDKQIVVIPSPYMFIPTATFAMKDYFIAEFNSHLIIKDINPVEETKIHRLLSYNSDYGAMDLEARRLAITGDHFHIDKEFVKGKFCIFLDDIRITGAHEERVQFMVDKYQLESDYLFLYYAELIGECTNPKIENYLNFYSIKSLLDINSIIQNQNFIFNTRVVKYILAAPEEECKNFLLYQSDVFRNTLYRYAVGNSYHKIEDFKTNLKFLKNLL